MDFTAPLTLPGAHKAELRHCQLHTIQIGLPPSLFLSIFSFLVPPACVWAEIYQGHYIFAFDLCSRVYNKEAGNKLSACLTDTSWKSLEIYSIFILVVLLKSFLLLVFFSKVQSMQPQQRFLLHSRTCCLTFWWSPKMNTLWRTSLWPWPAAPPQPHRFTSSATASGFTRTTTWLSELLTRPQVQRTLLPSYIVYFCLIWTNMSILLAVILWKCWCVSLFFPVIDYSYRQTSLRYII